LTSKLSIIYPAIDPRKYLGLAVRLALTQDSLSLRTAANSAYYSAFLFSRDKLAQKDYITPYYNYEDHKYVSTALKTLLGAIGNDEYRLRMARNKAVYDTRDLTIEQTHVRRLDWIIPTAAKIIKLVGSLPIRSKST